jgi:selenide,water dikinase
MGGRPLLALNLVAWNVEELGTDLLAEVLAGGADAAAECGFVIAGGHSIDDPEPKYGLAVIGEAHPDRLLTNTGFRAGDALVLTKALGVGIITTGMKAGAAAVDVAAAAVASMTRPNADAATAALAAGATGATDVTGFGLLGHLAKAAAASAVDVDLETAAVPVLDGVRELAADGIVPGGSKRNLAFVEPVVDRGDCDDVTVTVLADAQTSGGLVFGADPDAADEVAASLRERGHAAAVIGVVRPGSGHIALH